MLTEKPRNTYVLSAVAGLLYVQEKDPLPREVDLKHQLQAVWTADFPSLCCSQSNIIITARVASCSAVAVHPDWLEVRPASQQR